MISRAEFEQWKDSEISKKLYDNIRESIETVAAAVIREKFADDHNDTYHRGFIHALVEIHDWTPPLEEEDRPGQEADVLGEIFRA